MTTENELIKLRISLARIAQTLGVDPYESIGFSVAGKPYEQPHELASTRERGWNLLAGACVEKIEQEEDFRMRILQQLERQRVLLLKAADHLDEYADRMVDFTDTPPDERDDPVATEIREELLP